MFRVYETVEFRKWFDGIKDLPTQIRLARRMERIQRGQLGDVKRLTEHLYEIREFFGKGWRMYFFHNTKSSVLFVGGGTKDTQEEDVRRAKKVIKDLLKNEEK